MPRIKRITKRGIVYHVMNRANGKLRIFQKDLDFIAFENILAEGIERFEMRVCGYCIMSNHWHLVLWPRIDDAMPDFMGWITLTHVKRWHVAHGTVGIGHLYQDRYKSFPVESGWHYLKTMQYVESNPLRAGMVETATDWRWSSFAHRFESAKPFKLDPGPILLPKNWEENVNVVADEKDRAELRNCIKRGCPYGQKDWVDKTVAELKLESTLRKRGRPRRYI